LGDRSKTLNQKKKVGEKKQVRREKPIRCAIFRGGAIWDVYEETVHTADGGKGWKKSMRKKREGALPGERIVSEDNNIRNLGGRNGR